MPIKKDSEYKAKNSLRPNASTADASRGEMTYLQEVISVGDFGSWAASPTVVNGLPKPNPKPGKLGLDEDPQTPGHRSHLP